MTLFEDTNPHELKVLLDQIYRCDAVLPDFQRDFVWEPGATQELIVSIANNYPAGSLLRVRNTHNLFARREFQGAPAPKNAKPTFLVLDGQQRLTSLYQAFYGVGEHQFYLNLKVLIDGGDFDEAIFHVRSSVKYATRMQDLEAQAEELVLPLGILLGGAGGYGRWSKKIVRTLGLENGERVRLEDALDDIEENWIRRIDDYKFPVVTLSDETSADAVCTIFETLNRTGVKLSVFELLTARFWPKKVNLRQLWADACSRYPAIKDFEVDPYYVLQAISLAVRPFPSCKRSDVLSLTAADIDEHWDKAAAAMDFGLRILREDCGVIVSRWVPYYTMLVPLAGILTSRPMPPGPAAADARAKIVRWFWCCVFGQAYENSANSHSARDFAEVVAWLDGGEEPEVVREVKFDPRILRDTTPRQRSLYRGAICLVLRHGAKDFHTAQPISGDLIVKNHIDDHHIFPDAMLKRLAEPTPPRLRDCILNRTLIDRTTNQRISDRRPSDYMAEIRDELGEGQFGKLLSSHFVPHGVDAPIWQDDFEAFLEQRQEDLWAQVKEVTGITEASDLIEEEAAE